MNAPRSMPRPPARQRGAALFVGLVLMMVLTVLAMSTMRTSTLELTMAGNTQYRERARQLAAAGIADALDRIGRDQLPTPTPPNPDPTQPPPWTTAVLTGQLDPDTGDTYTVDMRYLYTGTPPRGQDRNNYNAHFFELQSTGATAARNARAVLRRGFVLLVPK